MAFTVSLVFLLAALICFVVATLKVELARLHFGWLGLACLAAALIFA